MFGVDCSSGDTFNDGKTSYSMVSRVLLSRLSSPLIPSLPIFDG